ncbi:3-dehydroquinate synthase II/3-amino-4-hydroxybenzoic acid synthase [Sporosarcina luteola]|nr:3-dehydroquinate synthase II/3-amino-4-hydroxybenzoic acid synthase [Sporosarcina luteola]
MRERIIWYDARNQGKKDPELIALINQSYNFNGILYDSEQTGGLLHSDRLTIGIYVRTVEGLQTYLNRDEQEQGDVVIVSPDADALKLALSENLQTGLYVYIEDEASMLKACEEGGAYNYLLVEFKDETNIPLELVIAKLQNSDTEVLKFVQTVSDAVVSKEVMEVGCDGFLIDTGRAEVISQLNLALENAKNTTLPLVKAKVTNVVHLGPGERACIDTTSLLTMEEAMIVGSTSSGGFLVCSETHYLPYMNTRPFRVNAGAVHSYVWCPNDTTEYMTDLKAGNKVFVIDVAGNLREVNIGRMKIEVRPLLLIEAEYEGKSMNTIVQDDWHIRIFDGEGRPKNATTFKVGDEILGYVCEPGRHVGVKIQEKILEN